jgi:predicted P-loop ATPase
MSGFPSLDEATAVAINLGWVLNKALSSLTEKRFGTHGSKTLKLGTDGPVWFDHEAGKGGGWMDLWKEAGEPLPNGEDTSPGAGAGPQPQAIYLYRNEKGVPLFEVVRFPNHKFLQRKPGASDWGIKGVRRVIYRLPELIAADLEKKELVFIPEGEKDVDNLRALGLIAICNPGGAGKWKSAYNASLKGRHCVVIPDSDAPGRQHADQIVRSLAGVAASVRRLELPGLPPKGDVSDWIAKGGTKDELLALLDKAGVRSESDWRTRAQVTDKGIMIVNLNNAALALECDPYWAGRLSFDEMRITQMLDAKNIDDEVALQIQRWLQLAGLIKLSPEIARGAIDLVAYSRRFHPLRKQLLAYREIWDEERRGHQWLHRYLGAVDNSYHATIGVLFLRSMIARILKPSEKVDYMLVLEGPQGILKSQACAVLAGRDYFSDTLPDLGSDHVRVQQHLRGKWLIEISKLSAFDRAGASKLKAFLTTQVEQYTPKYGRTEVREPRQCVFIGTTNKKTWLLDETGGRRFWPVECGTIDLDGLKAIREQLLAEAVVDILAGEQWWPERAFEEAEAKPVQDARYAGDSWEQSIFDWDRKIPEVDENGKPKYEMPLAGESRPLRVALAEPFYLGHIAFGALGIEPGKLSKSLEYRLTTVLETMGWRRGQKTNKGKTWWPPEGG